MSGTSDHDKLDDEEYMRTSSHGGCWYKVCGAVAFSCLFVVMTLTNLGISKFAIQSNKEMVVRADGVMIMASDSTKLISTVGAGVAFEFQVAMNGGVPYSCVGTCILCLAVS
jgi:hypothetical protein